jgi:hypothetical protein
MPFLYILNVLTGEAGILFPPVHFHSKEFARNKFFGPAVYAGVTRTGRAMPAGMQIGPGRLASPRLSEPD